jgi:hypothetical protein
MKYMLLIHDRADTRELFSGEGGAEMMADMDALMAELTASGELVGGEALADPSNTRPCACATACRPSRTARSPRRRSTSAAT